jgi:5'-methylthioadenosine phosphorylase
MPGLQVLRTETPDTPFGPASAPVTVGELDGHTVAFLPRHGAGHTLLPGEIPYRANVWALKAVGVTRVVGVSAVGSLREAIAPGDLALPGQYVDWTRGRRAGTFFGDGIVAHVSTAEPTCASLAAGLVAAASAGGTALHAGVTYAWGEGPRLGTRAESFLLRGAGCDLVGMTNVPEVFLAREAQLCYGTVCVVTDYDCWQEDPAQHVSVEKIFPLYRANLARVQAILAGLVRGEREIGPCGCRASLAGAVLTSDDAIPAGKRDYLAFLRR